MASGGEESNLSAAAAAAMEMEKMTVASGSSVDCPMQPVAPRSRALTPAEEKRKAYYAAQGREVEVRRMAEEDDDMDEEMATDYFAFQASRFRESYFGFFEDTKPRRTALEWRRASQPLRFASVRAEEVVRTAEAGMADTAATGKDKDKEDRRRWVVRWSFAVVGIMSTLLVYGVLQL